MMNQNISYRASVPILIISVCMIAFCGILYELLISTISAYLLGSSILHFSLTIGLFLSFMGLGAYLSRFFSDKYLLDYFITIEFWLGLTGGLSGALLYVSYAMTENYYLVAFLLIGVIGTLTGLEIPLLTRLIHQYFNLRETLAQVLSFDYLGALVASVIFPLFMLPYLGMMRTSFLIGGLNLAVGFFNLFAFKHLLQNFRYQLGIAFSTTALFGLGSYYAFTLSGYLEQLLYQDEIVYSTQSPYQRIVLTQWQKDVRLYINENLQFCSIDEYRYHESLIHIPLSLHPKPENVLILGGGDGLAVRELLKYPSIRSIDLVDLDKAITDLAQNHRLLQNINQKSLNNPKVHIYNQDAYKFVEKGGKLYSAIIIDLPDPNEVSLGKLYSKEFYALIAKVLAKDGIVVTQSTSPFFARKVFWCIHHTLESVFPTVLPYTVNVPSFGQWGFNVALHYTDTPENLHKTVQNRLDRLPKLRYLTPEVVQGSWIFDPDVAEVKTDLNTLSTQKVIQYYEEGWQHFSE
jgi:spermidine synthase